VGYVENASPNGAAVIADVRLDVGDSVPVKFHGSDVIGARIAWRRGRLMGLAF
jgi:translation initiation factor IF-1